VPFPKTRTKISANILAYGLKDYVIVFIVNTAVAYMFYVTLYMSSIFIHSQVN